MYTHEYNTTEIILQMFKIVLDYLKMYKIMWKITTCTYMCIPFIYGLLQLRVTLSTKKYLQSILI